MSSRTSAVPRRVRCGRLLPVKLQGLLGLGVHFFLLLFYAPRTAPPSFPIPETHAADAALPLAQLHQPDRIASAEARTAASVAELTLRVRTLPPLWALRSTLRATEPTGSISRGKSPQRRDATRLRKHLSAGLLTPYRSTAPPQL